MNTKNSTQSGHLRTIRLISLLTGMWIVAGLPSRVMADIFPPLCDTGSGGYGASSSSGINFAYTQAHLGDTVQVFPVLGMVLGACQAQHATGTVYIAGGPLVNFLDDITLDPGNIYQCPASSTPPCTAGPYNVTVTPALVGAAVITPSGTIPGTPNQVRAVARSRSDFVRSGNPDESFVKVDSASITIVTPSLQVFPTWSFQGGRTCFRPGEPIQFGGYVTNSGDIALTNITAVDSRAGSLALLDPLTGLPLNPINPVGPVSLPVGASATFANNFVPTPLEISVGSATNSVLVRATDVSAIGGPRASVTNSATGSCPICRPVSIGRPWITNGTFTFSFMTDSNRSYAVSYTGSLSPTNWQPRTNFTGDGTIATIHDALSSTQRFYRVQTQ